MTEMSTLPPVNELYTGSPDPLVHALTILFETSPSIASTLAAQSTPASSYVEVIDFALAAIAQWDDDRKAAFISGHPRIGEVKNLSQLSAKEQAAVATPPEVLARLHHLNACYERRYPGLRYITFVNGRSRAAIMQEMEDKLGFARTLSPSEPPVESLEEIDPRSEEWKVELERAVQDVGKIAKSRLKTLGVE